MAQEHVLRIKAVLDTTQLKSEINSIKTAMADGKGSPIMPNNGNIGGMGPTSNLFQSSTANAANITTLALSKATEIFGESTLKVTAYLAGLSKTMTSSVEGLVVFRKVLNHALRGQTQLQTATTFTTNTTKILTGELEKLNLQMAAFTLFVAGGEDATKKAQHAATQNALALMIKADTLNKATSQTKASILGTHQQTKSNMNLVTSIKSAKTATDSLNLSLNQTAKTMKNTKVSAGSTAKGAVPTLNGGTGALLGALGFTALGFNDILPRIEGAETATTAGAIGEGILGLAGGAAMGAAVGSVIPVFGTAIGATVGALIGLTSSVIKSTKAFEEQEKALKNSIQEIRHSENDRFIERYAETGKQKAAVEKLVADLGQQLREAKSKRDDLEFKIQYSGILSDSEKIKLTKELNDVNNTISTLNGQIKNATGALNQHAAAIAQERASYLAKIDYFLKYSDTQELNEKTKNENLEYIEREIAKVDRQIAREESKKTNPEKHQQLLAEKSSLEQRRDLILDKRAKRRNFWTDVEISELEEKKISTNSLVEIRELIASAEAVMEKNREAIKNDAKAGIYVSPELQETRINAYQNAARDLARYKQREAELMDNEEQWKDYKFRQGVEGLSEQRNISQLTRMLKYFENVTKRLENGEQTVENFEKLQEANEKLGIVRGALDGLKQNGNRPQLDVLADINRFGGSTNSGSGPFAFLYNQYKEQKKQTVYLRRIATNGVASTYE